MAETGVETDRDLLSRIATGDRSAMRDLYERHNAPLYRFLLSRLSDRFEAADVMQETFIDVWRGAGRFEGRSSVTTWMFGIARNKSIDRMRRSGRVVVSEPDETMADDAPDPEAVAEAASDADRVRGCIEGLGAQHRAAVELAFFQDLAYREIADIEGVPVGTVKTRIASAKQLLKRCLAAFGLVA
ncbi:RNA polymerase sigma factor [Amaricoccus tamworthensis]|uniref:RNA polymerase sigma factor n=1 Tax=Amaricoccus tamworthensis TaxID=57002 RepID=UPI003C79C908